MPTVPSSSPGLRFLLHDLTLCGIHFPNNKHPTALHNKHPMSESPCIRDHILYQGLVAVCHEGQGIISLGMFVFGGPPKEKPLTHTLTITSSSQVKSPWLKKTSASLVEVGIYHNSRPEALKTCLEAQSTQDLLCRCMNQPDVLRTILPKAFLFG